ncbi:MAG: hypothetical protein UX09_C0067G0003 [Candidatus Uhrbacteria bacterium GW2011_GWE2_45_35]|uniref:Uncharacterized protein n=1 Tax=Candidatus Uhrbacteria bacterium GW2011_GWE2_45_35 TaxID=1618993 RepID=A0A0G1MBH6_9BACT|nr:MAG: hypothetical protein UX09_C0067G0003 [Candidatus Uhrbacteria bacterium GW2011_GWE2_45_35]HBR80254.1 hypothetical protein [Candidatus Uhrbacteria bacterium]HCU31758.1 hypothetical protein [Candidatus Uhrbacteria bacterium]
MIRIPAPIVILIGAAFPLALLLLAPGCNLDYQVNRIGDEAETPEIEGEATTDTASEEPDDENVDTGYLPEDETEEPIDEEDTDAVDPNECSGFSISEGFGRYEITESYLIYSVIGDTETEIRQGEPAHFQFGITAHPCGDVILDGITIVLEEINDEPADWITTVEHSGEASNLSHTSGSSVFESNDGYNCNSDGYDSELFFWWMDDIYNDGSQNLMDEVYINAGTTEIFDFELVPTEFIEPGTTFGLWIIDPFWTDVETGTEVFDAFYWGPELIFTDITVKVVE